MSRGRNPNPDILSELLRPVTFTETQPTRSISELAAEHNMPVGDFRRWLTERVDLNKRLRLTGGKISKQDNPMQAPGSRRESRKITVSNPHRKIFTDEALEIPTEHRESLTGRKAYEARKRT